MIPALQAYGEMILSKEETRINFLMIRNVKKELMEVTNVNECARTI